eukprot:1188284-Prorocentrum_minimum.AAC.1
MERRWNAAGRVREGGGERGGGDGDGGGHVAPERAVGGGGGGGGGGVRGEPRPVAACAPFAAAAGPGAHAGGGQNLPRLRRPRLALQAVRESTYSRRERRGPEPESKKGASGPEEADEKEKRRA